MATPPAARQPGAAAVASVAFHDGGHFVALGRGLLGRLGGHGCVSCCVGGLWVLHGRRKGESSVHYFLLIVQWC